MWIEHTNSEVAPYGVALTFMASGPDVDTNTGTVLKMRPTRADLEGRFLALEEYREAVHLAVALDALVMPCWITRTFDMAAGELHFTARPPMVWHGHRLTNDWKGGWSSDMATFIEGTGADTWSDRLGAQVAYWWQNGYTVRVHSLCSTCNMLARKAAQRIARDIGIPYKRFRFLTEDQAPRPDAAAYLGFELLGPADIIGLEEALH